MAYTKLQYKKYAIVAAKVADDKKSENIKLIDLAGKSALTDYVVLATVESVPQMEAVDYEIGKRLKDEDLHKLYRDGQQSRLWRVLDYGGFMVHLATPDAREFYGLDKVFHFGKETKWESAPKPQSKPAAKKRKPKK